MLAGLLAIDVYLGLYRDRLSLSFPQETHHFTYVVMGRFVRLFQGWVPAGPCSVGWDCTAGFRPPTQPQSWTASMSWLWDVGNTYINETPLYPVPAAFFAWLFPGSVEVAAIGLRLWFAALLLGMYRMAGMVGGRGAGLLAVILAMGMPGMFGLSLVHQDSIPLAAIGVWAGITLLTCRGFSRLGHAVTLAILSLLAFRVPENTSGTMFVVLACLAPGALAVVEAVKGFRAGEATRKRAVCLAILLLPISTVLALWEGREHAWQYIAYGIESGDYGNPETDPNWFAAKAYIPIRSLAYVEETWRHLVWWWVAPFAWLGILVCVATRNRVRLAVAGTFLIPLVLLSSSVRIQSNYIIPELPGFATGAAIGLLALPWRRVRAALVAGAVLASAYQRLDLALWTARHVKNGEMLSTNMMGLPVIRAPRVKEGSAARAIADVVAEVPGMGSLKRVMILAATKQRSLATCWVIELEVPQSTCFGPVWSRPTDTPPALLDPAQYDVIAWIRVDGLHDFPFGEGAEIPGPFLENFDRMPPPVAGLARTVLLSVKKTDFVETTTPAGPVYVRAPSATSP